MPNFACWERRPNLNIYFLVKCLCKKMNLKYLKNEACALRGKPNVNKPTTTDYYFFYLFLTRKSVKYIVLSKSGSFC